VSLARFFRRGRWDDERARELEAHLQIEIDDNVARGMTPAAASDAARRTLGNTTRIREEIYDMNTFGWVDSAWRDIRFGARLLRRTPVFAAVAILSLALGVGANAAMFELLNAIRMRPLPVPHPEQLARVRIGGDDPPMSGGFDGRHANLTNVLWERLRDRQDAFSSLFVWGTPNFELTSGGPSRLAQGLWVSGAFFTTLDVHPIVGRLLAESDDRRGCASPPVVLSYGFWQSEYGGSPAVLERPIVLDGHAFDIVGVTPPEFFGVEVGHTFDVAVPLCAEPFSRGTRSNLDRKDAWFLAAIGRLKPGWSVERATAQLNALSPALFRDTLPNYRPEDAKAYLAFRLAAYPAATGVSDVRSSYEPSLWLLLATTALVLLIACANLANLMLARATARAREVAVRLALGASRARVVSQMAAESVLIAACGAVAGAVLGQWLSRALVGSLTTTSDRIFVDLARDWRVFAFIATVASAACVLFGVIPAIRATRTSPAASMKAGGRGSTDTAGRFSLRRTLVVAQVALSLVLVVAALLFVRTFRNLATLDAGFQQDHLLAVTMNPLRAGVPRDRLTALYRDLLDRVRREPGIDSAAHVRNVPIGGSFSNRNIIVDGVPQRVFTNFNAVSDRYFTTMKATLLAGRDFDERDSATAPHVAIVSEAFARAYFGGANPIGRTFQIDEAPGVERPPLTIVGLTRDSKYGDLRDPFEPLMFVPFAQDPQQPLATVRLVVRSSLPVSAVTAEIAAVVRQTNPAIVVTFRTMESQIRDSLVRERLMATLSGLFGSLAALIAAIGLYGVMSYTVARRRSEIGIRIALGADRQQVLRMVMREAGLLLAAGVVIGLAGALGTARLAASLLYGLTAHDPTTLVVAVCAMALIAAVASYVPARRASQLAPTEALRDE
jgi:predicted permease